jgi:hypothetical protein
MRRSGRIQLYAIALALWVPIMVGPTRLVPPCPSHESMAQAGTPATAHQHGGQGNSDESHTSCSCIGGCTVGRSDVALPTAPYLLQPKGLRAPDLIEFTRLVPALPRRAFGLYPTGPPVEVG